MYKYCNFLFHSSADGHLGCFHVLTVDPLFFKKIKSASSFPHPFAFPPLSVSMSSLTHFSFPSVSAEQESLILIKMNPSIETLDSIPFGDCNSPTLPFSSPTNAPSLWFHSFLVSFLLKTSLFWVSSNHLYWWTLFKRGFLLSKRSNRCWWGETGRLVHCRWECKLGQSPCKTVWKFLKKFKKNFEF